MQHKVNIIPISDSDTSAFGDFNLSDFVASEDSNLSRLTDLLNLPRLAYKKRQRQAPHFSPMALYLSAVRIAVLFSMHKFISYPIISLKFSLLENHNSLIVVYLSFELKSNYTLKRLQRFTILFHFSCNFCITPVIFLTTHPKYCPF